MRTGSIVLVFAIIGIRPTAAEDIPAAIEKAPYLTMCHAEARISGSHQDGKGGAGSLRQFVVGQDEAIHQIVMGVQQDDQSLLLLRVRDPGRYP
jgi:hypothetical protein